MLEEPCRPYQNRCGHLPAPAESSSREWQSLKNSGYGVLHMTSVVERMRTLDTSLTQAFGAAADSSGHEGFIFICAVDPWFSCRGVDACLFAGPTSKPDHAHQW